jgi:hypothetical protein
MHNAEVVIIIDPNIKEVSEMIFMVKLEKNFLPEKKTTKKKKNNNKIRI